MKVRVELDVNPFPVPESVKVNRPWDSGDSIPLSDIDEWTLMKMCDEFRNEVFKKARKSQPPAPAMLG